MKGVSVTARDRISGRTVEATQVVCPECDGQTFQLYVLEGGGQLSHNHLRCTGCETSFCQAGPACTAQEAPRG